MECKAVEEYKALEKKIDRLTVRMWVIIVIILILSCISNLILLFAFIKSQSTFEYVVEETTETEIETIVEQDGEGQNLAVIGNNNSIGGTGNGAENHKENNNKEENNS